MKETIKVGSDEVSVEPSTDGVTVGFQDYDSPIYGSGAVNLSRAQLRELIWTLVQADADIRRSVEVLLKLQPNGHVLAIGFAPGEPVGCYLSLLEPPIGSVPSAAEAKAWWLAKVEEYEQAKLFNGLFRSYVGAEIVYHGFPTNRPGRFYLPWQVNWCRGRISLEENMKKNEKKMGKASTNVVKVVVPKPTFKDTKALIKAVLNGEKPRGLKVKIAEAGGVSFSFGKEAIVCGKDAAIKDILGAIGIKVS